MNSRFVCRNALSKNLDNADSYTMCPILDIEVCVKNKVHLVVVSRKFENIFCEEAILRDTGAVGKRVYERSSV